MMKVISHTWVDGGGGTPEDIINMLQSYNLPPDARLTDIDIIETFIMSGNITQNMRLRFEWIHETK